MKRREKLCQVLMFQQVLELLEVIMFKKVLELLEELILQGVLDLQEVLKFQGMLVLQEEETQLLELLDLISSKMTEEIFKGL